MIEQFPSSELLQAKADFSGSVRLFLEQMGMVNAEVYVNINEQAATTVRLGGEMPVLLSLHEKYWDDNLLVSTMSVAGHTALSVAAWLNILDVTMNKVLQYPFLEEYASLTPMPRVPTLVVEISKRFGKPATQTATLRDIYWPSDVAHQTVSTAALVALHPLKPFTKLPTNKLITQRANEALKDITRSGAWRLIRNAVYVCHRYITHTNTGH